MKRLYDAQMQMTNRPLQLFVAWWDEFMLQREKSTEVQKKKKGQKRGRKQKEQPWQRPGKGLWGQGTVVGSSYFVVILLLSLRSRDSPGRCWAAYLQAGDNISKPYISASVGGLAS